jgi:hypothetical protein
LRSARGIMAAEPEAASAKARMALADILETWEGSAVAIRPKLASRLTTLRQAQENRRGKYTYHKYKMAKCHAKGSPSLYSQPFCTGGTAAFWVRLNSISIVECASFRQTKYLLLDRRMARYRGLGPQRRPGANIGL